MIKRPTDCTTSTASGQTDTTSGQTDATGGQTSTTSEQMSFIYFIYLIHYLQSISL